MNERFFDDWNVGDRLETGSIEVTRESALAFAREYDPQRFHLDDAFAERSFFGRLASSGWQTAGYAMRLVVESGVFAGEGGIGLGVDELRWLKPVYPGDTLRAFGECVGTRASAGKPSGIVRFKITTRNQDGADVMTHVAIVLVPKRERPQQRT
ncbi:MAG: MaoC family dehydratase [Candidatus Eremiobacteraeota bacterium]|nr:MaoC family dehydratase [Candidatus Eremiobacteraeota bacterium]